MASFKSSPIVAVFGGNDPSGEELAAARLLGAAVHQTDGVLLTGGRDVVRDTVKDAAVLAAVAVADPRDSEVWIGVARTELVEPPEPRPHGIILKPGGMDRRNFVEACLCDAAIAIGTSLGTSSEALFALYLRRRVTLVGFTPVGKIGPTAEALLGHARERVEEPVNPRNPVEGGDRKGLSLGSRPGWSCTALPAPDGSGGGAPDRQACQGKRRRQSKAQLRRVDRSAVMGRIHQPVARARSMSPPCRLLMMSPPICPSRVRARSCPSARSGS